MVFSMIYLAEDSLTKHIERLCVMSGKQTLREIIPLVMEALKELQYSNYYLYAFQRDLNCVVDFYEERGCAHYSSEQYEIFLAHIENEMRTGTICQGRFWSIRKCAYYLDEFFHKGCISPKYLSSEIPVFRYDELSHSLSNYLDAVSTDIQESTRKQRQYALQNYLQFLHQKGIQHFADISVSVVQQYFIQRSAEIGPRTLNQCRLHIRQFHRYLQKTGVYSPNWLHFLDFRVAYRKKMQGYLTPEETDCILAEINTNTAVGKRDYAIILLAKSTGLRGIDIINLKLSDIDWRRGIISLVQSKTGVPLQLPLLADTGEALKDYILHGRPESNCPEIFLRAIAPYTAIRYTSSLDTLIRKYEARAGVSTDIWNGKSFHGTRRGLGRSLVLAGEPVESVMQVLGHSHIDSAKPYMMLNTPEMKACALDLTNITVKRGELM